MKITRSENSISWQDENSAGSIGIIGSSSSDNEQMELYNNWVNYCASQAKSNSHTVLEAIIWMQERWDAEPLERNHHQMENAYASMVDQFCSDKLTHNPGQFSMELSDEEFEHWHKESEARRLEAENMPEEISGIKLHGFELPVTERNRLDMEVDVREFSERMARHHGQTTEHKIEPCFLIFEETYRNLFSHGVGSGAIGKQIGAYLGVTQEDIDNRSPRFLGYIMYGLDGLPTLKEFRSAPEKYIMR